MSRMTVPVVLAALALSGCEARGQDGETPPGAGAVAAEPSMPVCEVVGSLVSLPEEVRESSGLAASGRSPGVFWTHNDAGNEAEIYAVDAEGRLVQRVRVAGAESTDWEDLDSGPCDGGHCLFIADIGDNDADRGAITIYRVPEPEESASETMEAVPFHARFPEGPRDAESLFAGPDGALFIITKGRDGPIELYRYPAPQRPGETASLDLVGQLLPAPSDADDRVTAASASPDGRWVAIRTYRTLYVHPLATLISGAPFQPVHFDLTPLGQTQGESLAISGDGTFWLSSEAGDDEEPATLGRLRCTLPG